MKSVKAKFAKNLKSIKPIGYLNQERVLRVLAAADGLVEFIPKITNSISQIKTEPVRKDPNNEGESGSKEEMSKKISDGTVQETDIIDVSDLRRDLEEEEEEEETSRICFDDKENFRPTRNADDLFSREEIDMEISKKSGTGNSRNFSPFTKFKVSDFRRPDLDSSSLFDPNLLAAFEQAVKGYMRMRETERRARVELEKAEKEEEKIKTEQGNLEKDQETEENAERSNEKSDPRHNTLSIDDNPLSEFEERCPPGGEGSIILYTTTLRGIRKTFDDCNKIRFLLDNFRVLYYERDVSMHREYKDELWRTMEGKQNLPVLFIRGRCIGGAQDVLGLHEQGKFRVLFENLPVIRSDDSRCETCNGVRFVICFNCSGSHKVVSDNGLRSRCLVCNENGLLVCPFCC